MARHSPHRPCAPARPRAPPVSLLARIAQRLLGRPEADDQSAELERSGGRRRRRGRRGGRGPRRDGGESRTETVSTTSTNRNQSGRYSRRGRRTPRASLDSPLPEDIAFRPAIEGGDDSILPSRRRRPPGPRATKRVMLGGSRYVTGFSASEPPEVEREPDSDSPDDGSGQRRRRRGRRGGRGRRRGGSDSADAAQ